MRVVEGRNNIYLHPVRPLSMSVINLQIGPADALRIWLLARSLLPEYYMRARITVRLQKRSIFRSRHSESLVCFLLKVGFENERRVLDTLYMISWIVPKWYVIFPVDKQIVH